MNLNYFDRALTHLKTSWLKDFFSKRLPELESEQISIAQFAAAVDRLLQDRSLTELKQQKNPRSNIVQALKSIDPNHPAIPLVSLSTEQFRSLNEAQQGKLAARETRYIPSAEALVAKATALLGSAEWSDVAAGLAMLIGRRIGEIMLSKFSLKTAWSLDFSEMSKKSIAHQVTLEIPTLAPAQIVLDAIDKLRHALNIEALKLDNLNPAVAKKKVSDRYSQAVSEKCDLHYQGLVPARSDRESLYTHVFRAAYAAISIHWYCPPHIPDYAYRSEILGHYTIARNGAKLPDYKAGNNYGDYTIGTTDGNRDGRLGIRLGTIPDLQVLAVFAGEVEENPSEPPQSSTTAMQVATIVESPPTPDIAELSLYATEGYPDLDRSSDDPSLPLTSPVPSQTSPDSTTANDPLSSPKTATKRPELSATDIERMVAFWSRLGVDGSISHLFHLTIDQIWSVVDSTQPLPPLEPIAPPEAGVSSGDDLRWLVDEVTDLRSNDEYLTRSISDLHESIASLKSSLEARITATKESVPAATIAEVDDLKSLVDLQNEELDSSQQENARLTTKLTELQSKFDAIAQLFGGNSPIDRSAATTANPHQDTPTSDEPSSNSDRLKHTQLIEKIAIDKTKKHSVTHLKTTKHSVTYLRSVTMVERVVDTVIEWNDKQDRSDRRLLLSLTGLKPLCKLLEAASQPAIQEVLDRRAAEISQHHAKYLLGKRHNASIDKVAIFQAIAQHELKLPNWQDVEV